MATRLIAPQTAPPEDDAKLVRTSEAARMLGVSRRTLISRIERYNLPRPRKRDDGETGS